MSAEIWTNFREVGILRRVEEDPGTSVRRIVAAESIGVPLVWKVFHEQSLYPYHSQRLSSPQSS
jgi:hypothetical protein